MRYILTFFLVAACTLKAQTTRPTEASVNEMMRAMQTENLLNQAFKQMNDGIVKGLEQGLDKSLEGKELNAAQKSAVEKFRAKFDQTVKDDLSLVRVQSIYMEAYRETFTQEEVDAATAFYKSPAGQAMTEKYPTAMQKATAMMQARYGPLATKLQGMLDNLAKELESAK